MTTLVAVYRDRTTADAAAAALHERGAVADDALRVGAREDAEASLHAEMTAETAHSWGAGVLGLLTAEMMRGAVLFGAVGVAIGMVVGIPVGVFLYDDSVSLLTRMGVGALVGALFGSVVGTMLGGGMAMKSPEEGLAAERGVPVAIVDLDPAVAPELVDVLAAHEPIRVDRFVDGQPVETPVTEGPSGVRETIGEFVANAADPSRR